MASNPKVTVEIPVAKNGETIGLKEAALALGMTRQAAFHKVRNGTFPVATSLNGTRVRVSVAALRKHLGLTAKTTELVVDEPVKRARRSVSNDAPESRSANKPAAAKKAPAKKAPAKKATTLKGKGVRKAPAKSAPVARATRRPSVRKVIR